jgi:hypothetical protein
MPEHPLPGFAGLDFAQIRLQRFGDMFFLRQGHAVPE